MKRLSTLAEIVPTAKTMLPAAPLAPASGERGGGEGAGSLHPILTHAPSPPSPLPLQSEGERGAVRRPLSTCVSLASVAILLGLTATLAAQDETPKAAAPRAMTDALTDWEWFTDVQMPAWKAPPRWADFIVTPAVFGKARRDLGDLRLIDAKGQEVPYALRIRAAKDEQMQLSASEFNRAVAADRTAELNLDLGENPREHNEIRVRANGNNFRRRIQLEGSADSKDWQQMKLNQPFLVHFQVDGQTVDVNRFQYTPSRYRYLRIHLGPDSGLTNDKPEIQAATVWRTVKVPGENVTLPAALGERQPERGEFGQPGSAWMIDFGDPVPVQRLTFDVADPEFQRRYQLEIPGTEDEDAIFRTNQTIATGSWERRPGEQPRPLDINLHGEQFVRRLRLVVTDHGNPPLNVTAVRYTAPVRQVVFTPTPALALPLKLYVGQPKANRPQYDYDSLLPTILEPDPTRGTLGEVQKNPNYIPPAKPLTERWPWLVYVVLTVASLALLGILTTLGREAISRHDQRAQPPEPTAV